MLALWFSRSLVGVSVLSVLKHNTLGHLGKHAICHGRRGGMTWHPYWLCSSDDDDIISCCMAQILLSHIAVLHT